MSIVRLQPAKHYCFLPVLTSFPSLLIIAKESLIGEFYKFSSEKQDQTLLLRMSKHNSWKQHQPSMQYHKQVGKMSITNWLCFGALTTNINKQNACSGLFCFLETIQSCGFRHRSLSRCLCLVFARKKASSMWRVLVPMNEFMNYTQSIVWP